MKKFYATVAVVLTILTISYLRAQEEELEYLRPDESDAVRALRQVDFADSITDNDSSVTGIPSVVALQNYRDGFEDVYLQDPSYWDETYPTDNLLYDILDAQERNASKANRVTNRVMTLIEVDYKPLVGEEGLDDSWIQTSLHGRLAFLDTRTWKLSEAEYDDWIQTIRPKILHHINACHGLVYSMESQARNIWEDIRLAEKYRNDYYIATPPEDDSGNPVDYYSMYLTYENVEYMAVDLINQSLVDPHGWEEFYEHYDIADDLIGDWFRRMDDLPDPEDNY